MNVVDLRSYTKRHTCQNKEEKESRDDKQNMDARTEWRDERVDRSWMSAERLIISGGVMI